MSVLSRLTLLPLILWTAAPAMPLARPKVVPPSAPLVRTAPIPAALVPSDTEVPGVVNFGRVSEALWRGAQPTAEGFRQLEKLGVKTIVSFRHSHDDFPLLKGTRLRYLRLPSHAFHPTEANLARFLKVMEDKANWPVFIHCAQGRDRTGYNAAAYRIAVQGWTPEAALQEMHTFRFNRVWIFNPGFVRSLKADALKARVATEPAPTFQTWAP